MKREEKRVQDVAVRLHAVKRFASGELIAFECILNLSYVVHVDIELFELVQQRQHFAQVVERSISNEYVEGDLGFRVPEVVQLRARVLKHDVLVVRVDDVGAHAQRLSVVSGQAAKVELVVVHEDAWTSGVNESAEVGLEYEFLVAERKTF